VGWGAKLKARENLVGERLDLALELAALALRRLQLSEQLLVIAGGAAGLTGPVGEAQLGLEARAQHLAVGHVVLEPRVLIAQQLIGMAQLVQALLKILQSLRGQTTLAIEA
jgi:hypothetical protein